MFKLKLNNFILNKNNDDDIFDNIEINNDNISNIEINDDSISKEEKDIFSNIEINNDNIEINNDSISNIEINDDSISKEEENIFNNIGKEEENIEINDDNIGKEEKDIFSNIEINENKLFNGEGEGSDSDSDSDSEISMIDEENKEMGVVHIPKELFLNDNFRWGGEDDKINKKQRMLIKKIREIDDLNKLEKIEKFMDEDIQLENVYDGSGEVKENPLNNFDNLGLEQGECAYYIKKKNNCMKNAISSIEKKLKEDGLLEEDIKSENIIDELKNKLDCNGKKQGEKCVAEKLVDKNYITGDVSLYFKPEGPIDNKLFSNVNIDNVLDHFEITFPNYYHIKFLMNDWWRAPRNHEIHKLLNESSNDACKLHKKIDNTNDIEMDDDITDRFVEIIKNTPKTCFGCVLNTDMYSGPGIHWVSLFVDLRDKKNPTIEYFNSSGNAPLSNFKNLMEKLKEKFEKCLSESIKIIRVTKEEQQQSNNNCGSWAVFYQYNRLKGIPYTYFNGIDYEFIKDEVLDMFRKYIFRTIPE